MEEGLGCDEAYVACGDELEGGVGFVETPHGDEGSAEEIVGDVFEEGDGAEEGVGCVVVRGLGDYVLFDLVFAGEVGDWGWSGGGDSGSAAVGGCEDYVFDTRGEGGCCHGFALGFFFGGVGGDCYAEEAPWVFYLGEDGGWIGEVAFDKVDVWF